MDVTTVNQFAERAAGMRDGYPDFARRRRQTESRLLDYFDKCNYELVSSGAFEYVETLLRARPANEAEDWVQLFDVSGRAVALRPEMTPAIARMAAPIMAAGKGPVRWCYAEKVYRRSNHPASLLWASGKAAESTQVGVELVGATGCLVDVEIVQLCQEAIAQIQIPHTQIVVSHARFTSAFLLAVGVTKEWFDVLLERLTRGDYVGFRQLVAESGCTLDVLRALQSCNPFQADTLEAVLALLPINAIVREQIATPWLELVEFAQELTRHGLQEDITFDLTMHRDVSYYTGIVFEAFAPGVGAPIALGGRYDELLTQFGAPAPAIGFTFELERVLAAQGQTQSFLTPLKGDKPTC